MNKWKKRIKIVNTNENVSPSVRNKHEQVRQKLFIIIISLWFELVDWHHDISGVINFNKKIGNLELLFSLWKYITYQTQKVGKNAKVHFASFFSSSLSLKHSFRFVWLTTTHTTSNFITRNFASKQWSVIPLMKSGFCFAMQKALIQRHLILNWQQIVSHTLGNFRTAIVLEIAKNRQINAGRIIARAYAPKFRQILVGWNCNVNLCW